MPVLLCYDIENDRLRTKTADALLEQGFVRLQKSVFACTIDEEALERRLERWLQENLLSALSPNDKVLILSLTITQMESMRLLPQSPENWANELDPPSTLFI